MYQRLNGRKDGFLRTNSICPSPESVLLDLVKTNDCENIIRLISSRPQLLDFVYTPEYNKPILLIACTEDGIKPETVQTLIDLGADLHRSSEIDEDWEAIHFAACSTNSGILKVVVDNLTRPNEINAIAKGNNALHILIKHGRSELEEEFCKCAEILIRAGIDVNWGDSNCVSPILWAAKKGYKGIIKVILENGVNVDIDSHQSRNKTARKIIVNDHLYDGVLPEENQSFSLDDKRTAFSYLQNSNENGFINFKNGDIFHLVDADDTSSTLLQICCEKGLKKAAEHLIDKGADPNKITDKNRKTPIQITCENGFYDIFDLLINHPKIAVPKELLTILLKYVDNEKFPGTNHEKCYETLVKKLTTNRSLLDVNEPDATNNSPLHYAVRYADPEKIEELLSLGASLGAKNAYGIMPVQDMEPKVLEKHLDSCAQFDLKSKKFDKDDFTITFNYRTLIPPSSRTVVDTKRDTNDPETNFNSFITQELVAETEVISYMSQASEFKHLLKHPVIVSFLFMKWHRIRWLFYTNLAFYITFVLSLVVYIFTCYAHFEVGHKSGFHKFIISLSWVLLLLTFLVLVLRELFQIIVNPRNYFKNFENYIEIILIFLTGSILLTGSLDEDELILAARSREDDPRDIRKQLSSVSLLLAAFELVLMLGQHPKLSTNVVMLRTVSFNFFKMLLWYSLLIVAFALSFYILFKSTSTATADDEDNQFNDAGRSMFKTIIMLTGEFDAGSMNFETFPVTSKVLFSLFIFMIVIILLNLLNGLAVSDTQMIKNDAELVGHIARAQHIRYVESMLLGNVVPTNCLNKIRDFCCCLPLHVDWNFIVTKPLAERACLFPHLLNYEMTFFPNKHGQICLPMKRRRKGIFGSNCVGGCNYIYLDRETIRRTNNIVQEKREELKAKNGDSYLQKLEEVIKSLEKNASNDKFEILLLNKKIDGILTRLDKNGDVN